MFLCQHTAEQDEQARNYRLHQLQVFRDATEIELAHVLFLLLNVESLCLVTFSLSMLQRLP